MSDIYLNDGITTFSGDIASFELPSSVYADSVGIQITPVQSGSGTPSPTNVRLISGWTGANVTRTGKNLLSGLVQGGLSPKGTLDSSVANRVSSAEFISVKPGETYTISGSINISGMGVKAYVLEFAIAGGTDYVRNDPWSFMPKTFTVGPSTKYIKIMVGTTNDSDLTPLNIQDAQIEVGSTSTAFEPFNSINRYPISWQSEAGTVYGGTLDVTNGVLTVDRVMVTCNGSESWEGIWGDAPSIFSSTDVFTNAQLPKPVDSQDLSIGAACVTNMYEWYPYDKDYGGKLSIWHIRRSENNPENCCAIKVSNNPMLLVKDVRFTDADTFIAYLLEHPLQLVYELTTPITYQLTPTEITLLAGVNNVWADCGETEVKLGFSNNLNGKLIIDKNDSIYSFKTERTYVDKDVDIKIHLSVATISETKTYLGIN